MANYLLSVTKHLQKLSLNNQHKLAPLLKKTVTLSDNNVIFSVPSRNTNFFNKLPAESLWKGVTSVSNAGKKRGRGKTVNKRNIKDLNRGQLIGIGKANILWPGLSSPIIRGKEIIQQQQLPEDPEREKNLIKMRDQMGKTRYGKISSIDRGWTGSKMPGRSIGPPDPVNDDETYEGFDTRVLELKTIFNMTGNLGRKRRVSVLSVTGNKKGLAGFSIGKGLEPRTAMRKSKNRAGQKLMNIKIFNNHTVNHDFFTQFGATKIIVTPKPEGYGLRCHRAIKTICEVIGIKDLYAKVEGSTNVNHITKAFFLGLIKQKSFKEIAEEKGLHVVQFSKENGYFPKVLASPTKCRTEEEIDKKEILDFKQYCLDGRVILQKKVFPPFYTKHKSWEIYLKKQENLRNQDKVRINLKVEYGEIRSFLTDKYPECRPSKWRKNKQEEVEETE
ncbi:28S ribosomal protein S5, mitochondrial [Coccinella septempunctata]|uniref:28S ribosomal protein S5, mitochondrial n=1 Tax=Coccinella septempunctata TaxID=41139 RepID=UPI001D0892CC|nr:28S ribosomal protein S5, mitochondrial [Coccinella septempunctata]